MIIRRFDSCQQLITQPAHAALAARIMGQWGAAHFPETSRKASILNAVAQHDCGWTEVDETLVVDETTGQLLDFTEVPDSVKRDTSSRGIEPLSSDPYAAALAAQHRLHIYRRYSDDPEWSAFFAEMGAARDSYRRAAGSDLLDDLLCDYRFVRAGDLASLAFCNNWTETPDDGCGYSMHLNGASLIIVPDPLDGRTIEIDIEARVIDNQRFASARDARRVVASAPVVSLTGLVRGGSSGPHRRTLPETVDTAYPA
jgi:hypothetical protein